MRSASGRTASIAGGDGGEERRLVHRRLVREVGGRLVEIERDDAKRGRHGLRELIDRGAACREIRHHLRGDGGRKGRNAVRRHAVVAGEHQNVDPVEPRRVAAPLREPGDDLLQPAEAAGRLGQLGLARHHGGGGGAVAVRQVEACRAQLGERAERAGRLRAAGG